MKIHLVGYMGSGKTTLAKSLSKHLSINCIDLDEIIALAEGMSIEEIFTLRGEIFFRKKEHECLRQIVGQEESYVLALGGGTPVFYDHMKQIKQAGVCVYLKASPTFLAKRLERERTQRPLLSHISPEQLPEFIAKHLFERNPFYTQADFSVSIEGKTIAELTTEVLTLLKNHQSHP